MTKPVVTIENFDIETELTCRCRYGCRRFNYSTEFLVRLQAFRYMLGVGLTITGPGRCIKHNADEGGEPTSLHICEGKQATAIDVTNSNCKNIYEKACSCGLFNEVIWYKKKNFVHLGLDKKQNGNYFHINA